MTLSDVTRLLFVTDSPQSVNWRRSETSQRLSSHQLSFLPPLSLLTPLLSTLISDSRAIYLFRHAKNTRKINGQVIHNFAEMNYQNSDCRMASPDERHNLKLDHSATPFRIKTNAEERRRRRSSIASLAILRDELEGPSEHSFRSQRTVVCRSLHLFLSH